MIKGKQLISLRCKACGEEYALIACRDFELVRDASGERARAEALNWYFLGYCDSCYSENLEED